MKKKLLICCYAFFLLVFLIGCKGDNEDKVDYEKATMLDVYTTTHLNVVIVADLSNRIDNGVHPKPLHDTSVINVILNQIKPSLSLYKRKENQLDKWSLITPNLKQTLKYNVEPDKMKIDFSKFKNQLQRTNYLFGRDVERDFQGDLISFKSEMRKLYSSAEAEHRGLDLYQFFNENLGNKYLADEPATYNYMGDTYKREYRNILILLSDGYIESNGYDANCQNGNCSELHYNFVLWCANNANTIDKLSAFTSSKKIGITPVKNPVLEDFEVVIVEVDDRSIDDFGNRKRDGLTDFEITKFFWEKWMHESGAKSLTYLRQFESKLEVERAIGNILKGDG